MALVLGYDAASQLFWLSVDDSEQCCLVASLMLSAGLPFLSLQWLQLCHYKLQLHVQVWFLIQLLSCFNSQISVALVVGIVLPSAWSRSGGDVILVVLPIWWEKV